MPELPEVEVTLRGLAPHLEGRVVTGVVVRHHGLRWPLPRELPQYLGGARLGRLVRRGKYLLAEVLERDGLPRGWLLMHLGMTGTLRVLPRAAGIPSPGTHDHVDIALEDAVLRFRDPRRFGAILWHAAADGEVDLHPLLVRLGVEPFGLAFAGDAGGQLLYRRSRGRSLAIKSFLLAGQTVVGVGNIYASESLFRAGIRPTVEAGKISLERYQRLAEAIRQTLTEAVARGGSTLRDFVGSDGAQGYFQLDYFVYGRTDQSCRRCETPVRHLVQGQRSTYFCPRCQR